MASRNPVTAAAVVGIFAASLATGDVQISVQQDATYSLSESCGPPCYGQGAEPTGVACPKVGDVATADCHPHLQSYNGTVCVAPMDAQCMQLSDELWGCAFLKTEMEDLPYDDSYWGTRYGGSGSYQGTSYDEGVQVGDDEVGYTYPHERDHDQSTTYRARKTNYGAGGYHTPTTKNGHYGTTATKNGAVRSDYRTSFTLKGDKTTADYNPDTTETVKDGKIDYGYSYPSNKKRATHPGKPGGNHGIYSVHSPQYGESGAVESTTDAPCEENEGTNEKPATANYLREAPTDSMYAPNEGTTDTYTDYPSNTPMVYETEASTDYSAELPAHYRTNEATESLIDESKEPCDTVEPEGIMESAANAETTVYPATTLYPVVEQATQTPVENSKPTYTTVSSTGSPQAPIYTPHQPVTNPSAPTNIPGELYPNQEYPTESTESPTETEAPTEEPTTELPTEEPAVTEAPTEETVTESPTEEIVTEAPSQVTVTVTEAPSEETVTESPVEETVTEAPSVEPVTEAPVEETVTEAPSEEPVAEASSEETVTEAPSEETVTEAPSEET
ncbi:Cyst germination specific acidic repeat protein precursor, partial [Phytophthora megakarya]